MAFQVEFSRRAEQDIEEIFDYIHAGAPLNAVRWRRGLEEKLKILRQVPASFAHAAEDRDSPCEVRQIFYGRYRILYTIAGERVQVLTIRDGARLPMTAKEIRRIIP